MFKNIKIGDEVIVPGKGLVKVIAINKITFVTEDKQTWKIDTGEKYGRRDIWMSTSTPRAIPATTKNLERLQIRTNLKKTRNLYLDTLDRFSRAMNIDYTKLKEVSNETLIQITKQAEIAIAKLEEAIEALSLKQ